MTQFRADEGLAFMLQYENVAWYDAGEVRILDRRIYPAKIEFVRCKTHVEVMQAIRDMVTQSAGPYTAAAMGMALAAYECREKPAEEQLRFLQAADETISNARPTTYKRMKLVCDGCLEAAKLALREGRPVDLAIREHAVNANNRLCFVGSSETGSDSKLASFYDDTNDIRRRMWSFQEGETSGDNAICLVKFQDFSVSSESGDTLTYRYMTPLIRKSEMYLIAAECTDDITEAATLINTVRNVRGAVSLDVTPDNKQELITREFAREVVGEGQLFFYYKRLGMTSIISGTSASGSASMSVDSYVIPLPSDEEDLRN